MGSSRRPDGRSEPRGDTSGGSHWLLALPLVALVLLAASGGFLQGMMLGTSVHELGGLVMAVVAVGTGALIVRAQPRNPVGWLLLLAALGLAVSGAGVQLAGAHLPGRHWLAWVSTWGRPVGIYSLIVLLPLHFPDGLPPGPRWRRLRGAAVTVLAVDATWSAVRPGPIQMTDVPNPLGLSALEPASAVVDGVLVVATLSVFIGSVASVAHRYRHGGRTQRSQIKWLAFAVGLWLVGVLVSWPAQLLDSRVFSATQFALLVAGAGLPAAVGIAVLRHRLYDVDLILSRTLVYGALTVSVVVLYVVVVGYLGALLQASGTLLVSLLATAVVAMAFSPLRERLQRAANRLVYGDREDPYAALDRLGQRLDEAASPQQLLDRAAEEVADALRLRYVAIELDSPAATTIVAEHGVAAPGSRLERISLHAGGATVGWLSVGPVTDGEELSGADRKLLEALARPVGATLHAHRLAADLQRSREALAATRESERSRLHRDLHDGLGPELATVSMLAEAASEVLRTHPARAEGLLNDLAERARQAVADLRDVVHALRPPALDALGLVGALRAYAEAHAQRGLCVEIDAAEPLGALPAAIEVAAYRIAVEAITNVTRHAGARSCTVRLSAPGKRLLLEIVDDGRGLAADDVPGVGVISMQTRAAELGGACVVAAAPDGGTIVSAWLPLPSPARGTDEPTSVART